MTVDINTDTTQAPVISIVLPTYNGAQYIRQSIDSCLNQTFRDFELIIVNDCSTDGTFAIINEYAGKDQRIKVVNNEVNLKLPLSLNKGFDLALGQYHTWTSDDNYYAPNALETLLKVLQSDKNIDLVYTDYTIIDNDGKLIGTRIFNDINYGYNKWVGCGACFLYKATVYKRNNGYNPAAFLIEDYDFFVRAYLHFTFKYYPAVDLYYYREHSASLTSTQSDNVKYISKIIIEKSIPLLEKKLPVSELKYLYRKFAVFNAVQKNNPHKYAFYLKKLIGISKKQAFITVCYVLVQKLWLTISISIKGFSTFLRELFN